MEHYVPIDPTVDRFMRALEFAREAHKGQLDKSGNEYILHPIAVADIILAENQGKAFEGFTLADLVVAGYLHDTVEDCPGVTLDIIEKEFGKSVRDIVDGVTRRYVAPGKKEVYMDFIRRAKKHAGSKIVKLADLKHNRSRISNLPENERDIDKRYARAEEALNQVDVPPPTYQLRVIKQGCEVLLVRLTVYRPDGTFVSKDLDFGGNATSAVYYGATLILQALNELK